MCGIAGYVAAHPDRAPWARLEGLLDSIRMRGPDDEGLCLVSTANRTVQSYRTDRTTPSIRPGLDHFADAAPRVPHDLALIHTRFSILDLSDRGHQPFRSADGSVVAVYNGEIYNYLELREELEAAGVRFRSTCDTEALVEGYRAWGDEVWPRLNGFWSVALYDGRDGCLVFSRDRLGVAPLYYRQTPEGFFFASTIGALLNASDRRVAPNVETVAGFIETSLKDFDESTCYEEIHSLRPATVARLRPGAHDAQSLERSCFWRPPSEQWRAEDVPLGEAVTRYRDVFFEAVDLRMRADVKVAFELSGGLDSSSIVAAAASLGHRDITTYTIRVPEQDEEPYARSILEKYDVDYRVLSDTDASFVDDAVKFAALIEEPYHSPNIYTNYRMRETMKRQGVDVVLSGSGGDEVIAGYESSFWPAARADLERDNRRIHALTHDLAARFRTPRRALAFLYGLGRAALRPNHARTRGAPESDPGATPAERLERTYRTLSYHEQRLFHLQIGLLPYYLCSNDHFTMAIPMEHRFPFLDYRMVEMGMQMPTAHLFKNGWTKYVLRRAMEPYLPPKITWRREKMGFPFAYDRFLTSHRGRFEPLLEEVKAHGLLARGPTDFETLLNGNAVRLWRICSTGLWLQGDHHH